MTAGDRGLAGEERRGDPRHARRSDRAAPVGRDDAKGQSRLGPRARGARHSPAAAARRRQNPQRPFRRHGTAPEFSEHDFGVVVKLAADADNAKK